MKTPPAFSRIVTSNPRLLWRAAGLFLLFSIVAITTAMNPSAGQLVIYCGRGEELVRPLMDQFQNESGIAVQVRYGGTAELAATILEEGSHSPADVFFAQDAGALGALNRHGRLAELPEDVRALVPARYQSPDGTWIGISGRARVVVYNPEKTSEAELPVELFGFCTPEWKGRIGWAPENGSFQSFVTALRIREGDERALEWLKGIQANNPRVYAKNSAIVTAVAAGEVDAGFVNHYYLYGAKKSNPAITAANYFFPGESAGSLVNVAGAGILKSSKNTDAAAQLIRFLLSTSAQTYFSTETSEYPMTENVPASANLKPLNQIPALEIDLNRLDDLEGTLELIRQAGVL